jgi:hypothetical protein
MMLMGFLFMNSYSHSCIYINSFFFLSTLQSFVVLIHSVSQSTRKKYSKQRTTHLSS